MHLKVNYNENKQSEILGGLAKEEVEFLVGYALAHLIKEGVISTTSKQLQQETLN